MQLEELLMSRPVINSDLDTWTRMLQNNSSFTTNALNRIINDQVLGASQNQGPTMRDNFLPQKIGIFIWRARMDRLPVRVELDKRTIDLDSIVCPLCNNKIESVDHKLCTCSFAKDIRLRVFKWWKNNLHLYSSMAEMFRQKRSGQHTDAPSKIWQAIEWVVGYSLWKNRNLRLFRNEKVIAPVVFNEIQVTSFQWLANRSKKLALDRNEWLINPGIYDDHG
ncbi:uncharacterized protein [Rutidosis leptorrhynchoides]|uniref:uncharacterized protein n=1 Tax=Rutidosis leptorrhynchoides TaxID=125765 RepID=UPI003A9A3A65